MLNQKRRRIKMANRPEEIDDFDEEFEVKEYLIPKNIVNALIDNFSIIRNSSAMYWIYQHLQPLSTP
jgi:hypothetical protein